MVRQNMTEYPHYWQDPLKEQFDITVESIIEANGHTFVKIREPVVKPMGGGQAGDHGYIKISGSSFEFIDTVFQDDELRLLMKRVPPKTGDAVLFIDMIWRKAMMKNHTSEHLFVGSLKKKYPGINLGKIWIDGNHGTIVLEGMSVKTEDILETESQVQQRIAEAIPVMTKILPASEIDESVRAREGIISKHETLRIVEVGDFDSSACSGIHVTNTSEILVFKVIDIKDYDNSTHIEFISGEKAIESLLDLFNAALKRKNSYPFELHQLGAVLDKAKNLQEAYEMALQKIVQLMTNGPQKERVGEVEFWHEYLPGFDANTMRSILKEIKMDSVSIILFFAPGDKSNIVFWTKNMPNEASFYIQESITQLGGRGGGSKDSFTGGFTEVNDPFGLYQEIVNRVRNKIRTV
jgi:alanyl-tRNA synthetase